MASIPVPPTANQPTASDAQADSDQIELQRFVAALFNKIGERVSAEPAPDGERLVITKEGDPTALTGDEILREFTRRLFGRDR